jgi:hypothetical protein
VTDYVFRKFINAKVATTSGVALAKTSNSFGEEGAGKISHLKEIFGEKLPSLFRVVKSNRSLLRLEDDNDFEEQRAIKQASKSAERKC